jgi:hypothetical protein
MPVDSIAYLLRLRLLLMDIADFRTPKKIQKFSKRLHFQTVMYVQQVTYTLDAASVHERTLMLKDALKGLLRTKENLHVLQIWPLRYLHAGHTAFPKCLPIRRIGTSSGSNFRLPFVTVSEQLLLVVQKLFPRLSSVLCIRACHQVSTRGTYTHGN